VARNLVSAVVLLCVGVMYLAATVRYEFGDLADPKAGFFPLLVAGALVGIAGALVFAAFRHRPAEYHLAGVGEARGGQSPYPALLLVAAVLIYVLVVEYLGFLLTSAAFILFLMWVMGERNWRIMAVTSAATSGILYWLFWVQMRVPIPRGRLWGW
jgi:putative tricarboxylic transport membrane protein